jgi:hypothetical protein
VLSDPWYVEIYFLYLFCGQIQIDSYIASRAMGKKYENVYVVNSSKNHTNENFDVWNNRTTTNKQAG